MVSLRDAVRGTNDQDDTHLRGLVVNFSTTSSGRLARNAPRQLMVRGIWQYISLSSSLLSSREGVTYTIETYTLEADFTHNLSDSDGTFTMVRQGANPKNLHEGIWRVHGEGRGRLEAKKSQGKSIHSSMDETNSP